MAEDRNHSLDNKIKAKSDDPVWHLHEYGVDLQSNHIYLFGSEQFTNGQEDALEEPGVEYTMANRFIKNLNLCMRANPDQPVVIHMKTCGGSWTEGMAIYDAIKACPTAVTILNYTHARSMSSIIMQAANKRVMMPHSYFMFHEGTLAYDGTYKTVMSNAAFDKLGREVMVDIYEHVMKRGGKYSKRSKKFIRKWLNDQMDKKEDVFLSAKEAVELGFADSVFDYNWGSLTEFSKDETQRG